MHIVCICSGLTYQVQIMAQRGFVNEVEGRRVSDVVEEGRKKKKKKKNISFIHIKTLQSKTLMRWQKQKQKLKMKIDKKVKPIYRCGKDKLTNILKHKMRQKRLS